MSKANESPPPPFSESSPPPGLGGRQNLVPSNSSSNSSPPPEESASSLASPPPPISKSPPPSPLPTQSDLKATAPSPPLDLGSPPPSSSPGSSSNTPSPPLESGDSKAPPPPSNSKASPPPQPPSSPPPSPSKQSTPPSPLQSFPDSPSPPPPPPAATENTPSAIQASPPPSPLVSSPIAISSPELPTSPPQKSSPSPPTEVSPVTNAESSPPPPPTSGGQRLSPPSSHTSTASSNSKSGSSPPPGSNVSSVAFVGVAVVGVFVIALVAFLLVSSRRKKRQAQIYASHYMPPNKVSVQSDGYYYNQQHTGVDAYYQSTMASSSGSQRGGNVYNGVAPDVSGIGNAKSFFSYEELTEITNGFSRENVLGEGGFGCVYKGWLPDGRVVAVKQLKAGSGQGEREFRAEVEIISRVHHRYLVSLVGYCIAEHHRLLLYEFVPNKTLEHHLHGQGMPVLDWVKRQKIALGAAKGLAYLHEDCHPKIIHRDIKSANILLDDAFEAQVADFGLAKLANDTNTHVSTRVMGTFGYLAPEYASSGKLTDRSDVFSFGVVLLELVTGRKPVDPTQPLGDESLVEWARPLLIHALETGDFSELVDPRLDKHYVESEMFRMIEAAAASVRHSAPKRPRMVQVVRALDSEGENSDLSNGVKYGQSTIYDSGQYNQEITRFRRMALGDGNSSEYETNSGEYKSREMSESQSSWKPWDDSSGESETRAINALSGEHKSSHAQGSRF
ncbi:hypothetical protein I3842_05G149200 [Carya illinoinensis]|uniref:non-specific serine/threonine protein kinase n=1 Tax=Carya illinoinensis TaxID=32201 RepID=A0A922JQK5_CARIL|nr:hypothetical protein I3842_05G149200 [Carya illinoinensis]KAG6713392.1 hypothetical protein I3842_05G149200 [Carya illinoinensis]